MSAVVSRGALTFIAVLFFFLPFAGNFFLIMFKNTMIEFTCQSPITSLFPVSVNPNPPEDNPPKCLSGETTINQVLKLYIVTARSGGKDSLIYKNNGLTYQILDEDGNKTGIPIKASSIYMKRTLAFLKNKFQNENLRTPHKKVSRV